MGNAGSTQPKNKTGRKVVQQKLENAKKTSVLSLREHKLDEIPDAVFVISTLRTLDVSKNNLKRLHPKLSTLTALKSFNCDDNQLVAGSLAPIAHLTKLQMLSAGGNRLGKPIVTNTPVDRLGKPIAAAADRMAKPIVGAAAASPESNPPPPLPTTLPASLKTLKLNSNFLSHVPRPICHKSMVKLEKLDLSHNQLASVPVDISVLVNLNELNLDHNTIVSLPEAIGALKKLKSLSLKQNRISVSSTHFSAKHPQPLPASLFADTPLIDLNLHGNPMTSTELNQFEGYKVFLERREKVKTTALYGGALTNLDVCGLE